MLNPSEKVVLFYFLSELIFMYRYIFFLLDIFEPPFNHFKAKVSKKQRVCKAGEPLIAQILENPIKCGIDEDLGDVCKRGERGKSTVLRSKESINHTNHQQPQILVDPIKCGNDEDQGDVCERGAKREEHSNESSNKGHSPSKVNNKYIFIGHIHSISYN